MQVSGLSSGAQSLPTQSLPTCPFSIIEIVRVKASGEIVAGGSACPLIHAACNCQEVPKTACLKVTKLGTDLIHRHQIFSSSLSSALSHRKCVRNLSEELSS